MQRRLRTAVMAIAGLYASPLAACSQAAPPTPDAAAEQAADQPQSGLDPAILAASRTSPEAFVRAVVDLYKDGTVAVDMLPDNQAFFSSGTQALIDRVTANDEMAFGADPFCDCQDWMSLKVISADTERADETHATVVLTMGGDRFLPQRYVLVRQADGWRIDDVVHPEYGSMVARLEKMT